jgi:HEAT repeat protein
VAPGDARNLTYDELATRVDNGDAEAVCHAIWELGLRAQAGDTRAIPLMIHALVTRCEERGYPSITECAQDAFGRVVREPAVEPLIELLQDHAKPAGARMSAAGALGNIADSRALAPMLDVLRDRGDDSEMRGQVAFYLGRLGHSRVVDPLIAVAGDGTEPIAARRGAVHAFGELRDPRTFEALLSLLPHPVLGRFAGSALAELRDPRAVDALLPTIAAHDAAWRMSVAAIIGKVGAPAVPALLEAVTSPEPRSREGATWALGYTGGDPRARDALLRLLRDPFPGVREAAAGSLWAFNDDNVQMALAAMLRDDVALVRLAAINTLSEIAAPGHGSQKILPIVADAAAHDDSTIHGRHVVREQAARVLRDLNRQSE